MGVVVRERETTMPEEDRMYGLVQYWDDRYGKEAEEFEWYQSYDNIKDKIKAAFPDTNGKILNLGSGSSRLPVSMYLDGYKNITSVDFSQECIKLMQGKFADKAELEWKKLHDEGVRLFERGEACDEAWWHSAHRLVWGPHQARCSPEASITWIHRVHPEC